ncbi:hypothetical protein [Tropicimonas sediminicola]|uniref:hypothetical protein n=1 Tax=Tropicimonas sediminicola TaxID=1031541 RepID=UPI0015962F47|nr:hypothetical protein [Tropicimonas sediminicola]
MNAKDFEDALPCDAPDSGPLRWAPPEAPLAMQKQVLETRTSWADLALVGRLFLSRRKA